MYLGFQCEKRILIFTNSTGDTNLSKFYLMFLNYIFTVWVIEGPDLIFDSARRDIAGGYSCHADNKVTNPISRETVIDVTCKFYIFFFFL